MNISVGLSNSSLDIQMHRKEMYPRGERFIRKE